MLNLNDDVSLPCKILLNTSYILFYPILYLLDKSHARRHDKRDGYRRTTPKPLPLKPPSTLGIPRRRHSLSTPRSRHQKHVTQSTSTGLFSLPPEIRDQIWAKVFSGKKIHLWIQDRKLRGFKCNVIRETNFNCWLGCWMYDTPTEMGIEVWAGKRKDPKIQGVEVMGALQSCRQIYVETIHLLYSANTFLISDADTLAHLPTLLLPAHFHQIQTLHFHWRLRSPPSLPPASRASVPPHIDIKKRNFYRDTWNTIWKNLAEIQGLRYLMVDLNIVESRETMWNLEELEVVQRVVMPEVVVVCLRGILYEMMVGRVGGVNCRVERVERVEYD